MPCSACFDEKDLFLQCYYNEIRRSGCKSNNILTPFLLTPSLLNLIQPKKQYLCYHKKT